MPIRRASSFGHPLDAIRFVAEAPQQAQAPMALGLSDRAGSAFTTSVVNVRNCPNKQLSTLPNCHSIAVQINV